MPNKDMIPIEVIILTDTDDIKGTVFVSSTVAANRQLTELLSTSFCLLLSRCRLAVPHKFLPERCSPHRFSSENSTFPDLHSCRCTRTNRWKRTP